MLKLTIAIPTFNRADWLAASVPLWQRQIVGLEDQVELIVLDNASTDSTQSVLFALREAGPIRIVRHQQNKGAAWNFSQAAQEARGKYVWVVGDDDLPLEGAISRALSALQLNPNVAYLFVNYRIWHPSTQPSVNIQPDTIPSSPENTSAPSRRFEKIGEVIRGDRNIATTIYSNIFRVDHARKAFAVPGGKIQNFSSLASAYPHGIYTATNWKDLMPGFYISEPAILASFNVRYNNYLPILILEYLPRVSDLYRKNSVSRRDIAHHQRLYLYWSFKYFLDLLRGQKIDRIEQFSFFAFFKRNFLFPEFYVLILKIIYSIPSILLFRLRRTRAGAFT